MEILSVVCGLESIKYPCQVSIYSDSQYVIKGMTEWMHGWKARSFRNVKNKELWQRLEAASQPHKINWNWVRGHAGDKWNEKADELANAARRLLADGYLKENQLFTRTARP
jgi:ribonuclease HI